MANLKVNMSMTKNEMPPLPQRLPGQREDPPLP